MYLQKATPAAVITDKSTSTDDAPANRNSQDPPRTSTRREESGKSPLLHAQPDALRNISTEHSHLSTTSYTIIKCKVWTWLSYS